MLRRGYNRTWRCSENYVACTEVQDTIASAEGHLSPLLIAFLAFHKFHIKQMQNMDVTFSRLSRASTDCFCICATEQQSPYMLLVSVTANGFADLHLRKAWPPSSSRHLHIGQMVSRSIPRRLIFNLTGRVLWLNLQRNMMNFPRHFQTPKLGPNLCSACCWICYSGSWCLTWQHRPT